MKLCAWLMSDTNTAQLVVISGSKRPGPGVEGGLFCDDHFGELNDTAITKMKLRVRSR